MRPRLSSSITPWQSVTGPHEDVVGKRITFQDAPKKDSDWMTIVGVVGDVKDQPNSPGAESAFWWSEFQVATVRYVDCDSHPIPIPGRLPTDSATPCIGSTPHSQSQT